LQFHKDTFFDLSELETLVASSSTNVEPKIDQDWGAPLDIYGKETTNEEKMSRYIAPAGFGFSQLLATKSCYGLPNTQLFSQLL
jgi:hypothetical protein